MQSKYIKSFLTLVVTLLIVSCTKEISIDVAHEPQTIIYGELTNLNELVKVTVQQTVPLNSTESFLAVNDAIISVYEKNTNGTINLITTDFSATQGVYTSNQPVATTIGNAYWIEVVLNNGTLFKSEEETMFPIVPISEVTVDEEFDDVLNIKFSDPEAVTNFYKTTVNLYNQGQLVSRNFSESNDVVFNGNNAASLEVDKFSEGTNSSFDTTEVVLGNINFSSYQFLLNQRAQIEANEDAGETSGGDPSQLFSTPPVNLLGNITNVNTNRITLGNFTIISKSIENQ